MKKAFFKNLEFKVKRRKYLIVAFAVICAALFAAFGYIKAGKPETLTEAENEAVSSYSERLKMYEDAVADTEKSLNEEREMVRTLQDYADNSILMKIDPSSVKVASLQFGIYCGEGVPAAIAQQSLLSFVKDGELRENIGEQEELGVKYWDEVLTAGLNGNVLSVSVMHYDAEKAHGIIEAIRKEVLDFIPVLSERIGPVGLKEVTVASFEKSDSAIVNTQNTNRSNLRAYYLTCAELETKLAAAEKNRDQHVSENRPPVLDRAPVSRKKNAVKYAIVGAILGIAAVLALYVFIYVFNPNICSEEDLRELEVPFLGTLKNGKPVPGAERLLMDTELALSANGKEGFYTCVLEKAAAEQAEPLNTMINGAGVLSAYMENADEMKALVGEGACVLLIRKGKSSSDSVRKFLTMCSKFRVTVIGCVLAE